MARPGFALDASPPHTRQTLSGTVGEDVLTRPLAPAPVRRLGHARENPRQHFGRVGRRRPTGACRRKATNEVVGLGAANAEPSSDRHPICDGMAPSEACA